MEATFSVWFLGPYKVSKIGYGLFSYALQPAKRTSTSFMGAILKEYLVHILFLSISTSYDFNTDDQRWKNVPACQQCWCKFFASSDKICAKLYAVLLQK